MEALLDEIRGRLRDLLTQLARGGDAPPAQRLQLEGMLEAAVLAGAASSQLLDEELMALYQEAFERTLEEDFGADWRDFYPFPQIPATGRRAPVYPSTRD